MARTIIEIPEAQLRDVDALCKLLGISRAEATRRALREFVSRNDEVRTDGFGLWKGLATSPRQGPGSSGPGGGRGD